VTQFTKLYISRFRHFQQEILTNVVAEWKCPVLEKVRRLIDLATVSVLLDASTGEDYTYRSHGKTQPTWEGIAAASFDMFIHGFFSSDPAHPARANSYRLKDIRESELKQRLQIDERNTLVAIEAHRVLLTKMGDALDKFPEYFGYEISRPGNVLDYVLEKKEGNTLDIRHLWECFMKLLNCVWPKRATGISHGDVWCHSKLQIIGEPGSDLVPFHKLTQWLLYSIIEPIETYLQIQVVGVEDVLTALAESRNGGLLVDSGVLVPKDPVYTRSREHAVGSELITEWRALTIVYIDRIAIELRSRLGKTKETLPLRSVLEGGTWRAGRFLARQLRPQLMESPIRIADGVVF